jgi:hypothetical protein
MARNKKRGDIDADYHAIRARLTALTATGGSAPTTVPPHGHAAANISFEETQSDSSGRLAADDVQEALEELDSEKLARSGEQPMLGNLDMNHWSVNNVNDLEVEDDISMTGAGGDLTMAGANGFARISGARQIEMVGDVGESDINGVRDISMIGSAVGEGVVDGPRVIHMQGDNDDGEAKVDGLERVVFNNEPTKSSIEQVSRIEYNVGVTAASSYTPAEGISSWDTLEDILVAHVASGVVIVAIAFGWGVEMAMNGYNPA